MNFNGISGINDIYRMSDAKTRSISPENFSGEKGGGGRCSIEEGTAKNAARELGTGWKVNPYIKIKPGEIFEIAMMNGPGCIQHIWLTPTGLWRDTILRIYWDGQDYPSVESPIGDFFACGWNEYAQVSSLAVCVNPGSAFNCYWPMPFRKSCRMTLENLSTDEVTIYYQIDYCLTEIPEDAAYFHARFRRENPQAYGTDYTIISGIQGRGHFVGTYMARGVNNQGWWGEGEIKFFIDDDEEYPTICGTGTEDYFCGSYNFEDPKTKDRYVPFSTPYSGLCQVLEPNRLYRSQMRFGMYRWHITDPVRFEKKLRVTLQSLGWRSGRRYLPLQDDMASVAYWYQTIPGKKFEEFYSRNYLEII